MSKSSQIVDLHAACLSLKETSVLQRSEELSNILPKVAICAMGGFPFIEKDGQLYWCNNVINTNSIPNAIKQALGLSAVLTYTNPKNRSLESLGDLCLEKNHCWAYHWINLSLVFAGWSPSVELSFLRDNRFKTSWTVSRDRFSKVFVATAGIKQWIDFTSHFEDSSFDEDTRQAMANSRYLVIMSLPEVIENYEK